jgi:formylglycine-generating enzyme required for sulfatase activity
MLLHNQYEFNPEKDLIAKGGFAEVYLAFDRNLNKKVAIKRFVKDAGTAGSVIKEIQKSIDFNHPNIIRYFNCFTQEYKDHLGRTITEEYGVMEYANAGNLGDIIKGDRKLSEEQFKQIVLGILDGLQYLHSRQPALIHRDLKPSNILLHEENGQLIPKICDFGISKELQGTVSQTGTAALGTIDYMAPEQINGSAPSPATDLWAVGCMVYEYFVGQSPFGKATQGASAQQVYYKVLNGQIDKNAMQQIPEPFRALVKQCLVVDREKRVKSAVEGKEILLGDGKKPDGGSFIIPPKVLKAIMVTAAVLLFTGAAWWIWPSAQEERSSSEETMESETLIENAPVVQEKPVGLAPSSDIWQQEEKQGVEEETQRLAEERASLEKQRQDLEKQKQQDATAEKQRQKQSAAQQQQASSSLLTPIQKLINDMVSIPGESFDMGCSPGDDMCWDWESPRHWVTLSAFKMGKFEVTQAQWRAVMGTSASLSDPSYFKNCDNCPVEQVSWNDIVNEFILKLNRMTGMNFRLPTEAEWEYAARGGATTRFYTGGCLSTHQANYDGNYPASGCSSGTYREKTLPVGSFSPNGYGLHDMHGNVWEWCSDWYGTYSSGNQTNPKGPSTGASRVFRGGGWGRSARRCRVSDRYGSTPADRHSDLGFRLAHD